MHSGLDASKCLFADAPKLVDSDAGQLDLRLGAHEGWLKFTSDLRGKCGKLLDRTAQRLCQLLCGRNKLLNPRDLCLVNPKPKRPAEVAVLRGRQRPLQLLERRKNRGERPAGRGRRPADRTLDAAGVPLEVLGACTETRSCVVGVYRDDRRDFAEVAACHLSHP